MEYLGPGVGVGSVSRPVAATSGAPLPHFQGAAITLLGPLLLSLRLDTALMRYRSRESFLAEKPWRLQEIKLFLILIFPFVSGFLFCGRDRGLCRVHVSPSKDIWMGAHSDGFSVCSTYEGILRWGLPKAVSSSGPLRSHSSTYRGEALFSLPLSYLGLDRGFIYVRAGVIHLPTIYSLGSLLCRTMRIAAMPPSGDMARPCSPHVLHRCLQTTSEIFRSNLGSRLDNSQKFKILCEKLDISPQGVE